MQISSTTCRPLSLPNSFPLTSLARSPRPPLPSPAASAIRVFFLRCEFLLANHRNDAWPCTAPSSHFPQKAGSAYWNLHSLLATAEELCPASASIGCRGGRVASRREASSFGGGGNRNYAGGKEHVNDKRGSRWETALGLLGRG